PSIVLQLAIQPGNSTLSQALLQSAAARLNALPLRRLREQLPPCFAFFARRGVRAAIVRLKRKAVGKRRKAWPTAARHCSWLAVQGLRRLTVPWLARKQKDTPKGSSGAAIDDANHFYTIS